MKPTFADTAFYVVAYKDNKFVSVVSGMGCNRGTLDASHSKIAAKKHAARMAVKAASGGIWAGHEFRVEGMVEP